VAYIGSLITVVLLVDMSAREEIKVNAAYWRADVVELHLGKWLSVQKASPIHYESFKFLNLKKKFEFMHFNK
jgi:pyridoxine 5'-phosphate synthase PdxJ